MTSKDAEVTSFLAGVRERMRQDGQEEIWQLNRREIWWRDREDLFKRHGYILRPRYRAGWVPSWLGTERSYVWAEDGNILVPNKTMDAVRVADGSLVFLKKVPAKSCELSIAQFLTTPDLLRHPENHCVPILDHFPDEIDDDIHIMVMPFLYRLDEPPFESVDQVLDFVNQTLEGLNFIHGQGVAHRDCSRLNIMHGGSQLYPRGHHPVAIEKNPSYTGAAKVLRRSDVSPIKYYFIDFGLSTRFEDPNQPHLVTGAIAADDDVPEISDILPYDPFRVDIFTLGNIYKKYIISRYTNLDFLLPLTSIMLQINPLARPSAAEALETFRSLRSKLTWYERSWRLQTARETSTSRLASDVRFATRTALRMLYQVAGSSTILVTIVSAASVFAAFLPFRRHTQIFAYWQSWIMQTFTQVH